MATKIDDYHIRQWKEPHEQTLAFVQFIEQFVGPTNWYDVSVLDVGCGAGGATHTIATMLGTGPKTTAIDYDPSLIAYARSQCDVIDWRIGDMTKPILPADIVYSLQTLSFVTSPATALRNMVIAARRFLFISSLFNQGEDTYFTLALRKSGERQWYNVYAIRDILALAAKYRNVKRSWSAPFIMTKSLPQTQLDRQTYTVGDRQFSGPLHLPWYFVGVELK